MSEFSFDKAMELYNSFDSFPVDFEDAWVWYEFSRKDSAKASFKNCGFIKGVDFISFPDRSRKAQGGRSREIIKLSFDCFTSWAILIGKSKGFPVLDILSQLDTNIQVVHRKRLEMCFKDILLASIGWKTSIIPQYSMEVNNNKYRIDFYLPEYHLAIEYDEYKSHKNNVEKDKLRQKMIEKYLGCSFIRVYEGLELKALEKISKIVFKN